MSNKYTAYIPEIKIRYVSNTVEKISGKNPRNIVMSRYIRFSLSSLLPIPIKSALVYSSDDSVMFLYNIRVSIELNIRIMFNTIFNYSY